MAERTVAGFLSAVGYAVGYAVAVECPGAVECTEVDGRPVLVWRFAEPRLAIASSPLGGGIGLRRWVVNAEVADDYDSLDPASDVIRVAAGLGLSGAGVGMLTAARVRHYHSADDGGVEVAATVGITHPVLAAAPAADLPPGAGTINIVVLVPAQLSDAALVNAVATATEAKGQALRDAGLDATGTPTDAVCIACPAAGREELYGGPRSRWGAPLARAVHTAVLAGSER